jgi:hypothetical protein
MVFVVCAFAAPAQAQVFSPGEMSKAHKDLDGLTGCTKCHPEGGQHDNKRCTECHKEIGRRQADDRGFHARNKNKVCAECHREHRGLNATLIEWTPSKDRFNHNLSGWPLEGPHKEKECTDCHETRRMIDDEVKTIIKKNGREDSMLGLGTKCITCHHDEHRGQEGNDCKRCHTVTDYKKYPLFDHNKKDFAKFPLIGKHKKVECKACHDTLTEPKRETFPAPKDDTYLQLKDIPHNQCVECHDDFHEGAFGNNCTRCHTPEGFRLIKPGAKDTGFHDKHAFKLRGQHAQLDCKQCHGPFGDTPAKFKGIKFKHCADCHADAHVGQLAKEEGVVKCENCHQVGGFLPVNYDTTRHEKTRFPLVNAHKTVSCSSCHEKDAKLADKMPRTVLAEFAKLRRAVFVSEAKLKFLEIKEGAGSSGKTAQCEVCHSSDDPHGGQFIKPSKEMEAAGLKMRGCGACHATTSFTDQTAFSHDDTRFPLVGKHKPVDCSSCHAAGEQKGKSKGVVRYRPLEHQCGDCHADEHVGQLTRTKEARNACSDCHTPEGFAPAKFDHDTQSAYPLVGRHEQADCKKCHPMVDVGGNQIARYKPVPTTCIECHEDEHEGAFDGYYPTAIPTDTEPTESTTTVALMQPVPIDAGPSTTVATDAGVVTPAASTSPEDAGVAPAPTISIVPDGAKGRCDGCHTPLGWGPADFAHERTGWPLTGRHQLAACFGCHQNNYQRSTSTACATCHRDPHAQEFGANCQGCHTTEVFTGPMFPVDAHRRLNFPLVGRHAVLPCDECHVEKRDRTYTRAALDCASCHRNDARAAAAVTVNHNRAPFTANCQGCHTPISFKPATFAQHDKCFPVSRGSHAGVRCLECHTKVAGENFTGDCDGVPVRCAECHTHRAAVEDKRHAEVPGYAHRTERCVVCHRAP